MNTILKHTALASMLILGTGHSLAEIQQPEPEQSQQGCETFFVHSPSDPGDFYDPEFDSTESTSGDFAQQRSVSETPSQEIEGQEQSNCTDQTGSSTRTQTLDFVGNLGDRIAQQRTGFGNRKVRTSSLYQPLGGAAGADDIGDSQRLSPFVVVDASESDRRSTAISRAYDQDNNAVILGFDYRLGDSLIAGATLNYLDSETEYDANQGSIDGENIILGLHGSKYWGDTYLDALITYGQIDLDIERISPGGQFDGSTDGDFHSAELALGHLFGHKAWSITPSVRLLHLRGSLDG